MWEKEEFFFLGVPDKKRRAKEGGTIQTPHLRGTELNSDYVGAGAAFSH